MSSIERTHQILELYLKLGTYQKVGDELGITRQRVEQILKRGFKLGIIQKPQTFYEKRDEKTTLKLQEIRLNFEKFFAQYGSIEGIANQYNISKQIMYSFVAESGYSKRDINFLRKKFQKQKAYQEYIELANKLGFHPNNTWMQYNGQRALASRIQKNFLSFANFIKAYNLPIRYNREVWRDKKIKKHEKLTDEVIFRRYMEAANKVGFLPSSQVLSTYDASLLFKIYAVYGSFKVFCKKYNITIDTRRLGQSKYRRPPTKETQTQTYNQYMNLANALGYYPNSSDLVNLKEKNLVSKITYAFRTFGNFYSQYNIQPRYKHNRAS